MPSKAESLFGFIGRRATQFQEDIHETSKLINDAFYWTIVSTFKRRRMQLRADISEMVKTGYDAVPIVAVISLFVGIILALQAAYQLRRVGALIYVANLVGVSMTRELGPMLTAIIVAGRSGSAFAAEIGSMKVEEEVDALVTMGINPVRFLVVPKLIAMMIMVPALTVFSDLSGIAGGFSLSTAALQIPPYLYIQQTINSLLIKDILTGLIKAWAFGVAITVIGTREGFKVEESAVEVGRRTTASVVTSIFLVIVLDLLFTALFYYFS